MDKRGILGLDTVKVFILALMIIAILVIVSFEILTNLRDTTYNVAAAETTVSFTNRTTTLKINDSVNVANPEKLTIPQGVLPNCALTITVITNTTGSTITSGNYTIAACSFYVSGTSGSSNNSFWNVTGSYTYDSPYVQSLVGNTTKGFTTFFSNVPTFFTLLGVVVLILIIAIVIVAVSRFGVGAIGGQTQGESERL